MQAPVVLLFALLLLSRAGAEELSTTWTQREIPIREPAASSPPIARGDGYRFELRIDPAQRQWKFTDGENQQSVAQNAGLIYKQTLLESVRLEWESLAGASRNESILIEPDESLARETMALTEKVNLVLQPAKFLTANVFVQGSRTIADGSEGFEDAARSGANIELMPWHGAKISSEAARQARFGFDGSILYQNLAGARLEQKLAPLPLTIKTAARMSAEDSPLLMQEKEMQQFQAALAWEVQPRATWSAGMDMQETSFASSAAATNKLTYFTELGAQLGDSMLFNLRAGYETGEQFDPAGRFLPTEPAVSLGLGVKVKMTGQIQAGFGVRYRVPEVQPAATPAGMDESIFSLSAPGFF
jgi:hypothetical protein